MAAMPWGGEKGGFCKRAGGNMATDSQRRFGAGSVAAGCRMKKWEKKPEGRKNSAKKKLGNKGLP